MTTADKIRRFMAKGVRPVEIAAKLGVNVKRVHKIKWQDKKKDKPTKLIVKPKNLDDAMKLISAKVDAVNHPAHYTTGGIDFLDYAEAKGLTKNAYLFNVVKYVSRAGKKVGSDPLEDLKKAEFYLKREIATRERA